MTNGRDLAEIILVFADICTVDPRRFSRLDSGTATANYHDYISRSLVLHFPTGL